MQSWFDDFTADDIAENYLPPGSRGWHLAHHLPARSGPIDTEYHDGLTWWWTDDPLLDLTPPKETIPDA